MRFWFHVAVFAGTLISAQPTALDPFVAKDLIKERLFADVEKVVGKAPKGYMMEPVPWYLWKTDRNGQTRYVLLFGESLEIIPGGSSACVLLFDGAAKRIASWSFQAGWRITLDAASFQYSTDFGSELILIRTSPVVNGADIAKEYFVVSHDRLRLVRLENSKGEIVQNEYIFPNYEIGVIPAAHSVEEWMELLSSSDKADVLSALVFLGGRHLTEQQHTFPSEPKESRFAGLFTQLITDRRVLQIIERLRTSENPWIAQAAALAARGPRERPLN